MQRFGKYEVVRKIGEGGFGKVYEGWDPDIKRRVAIKTCLADYPEVRTRFLREASIAGNLQHRNITVVFDLGEEGGVPYLVQEYLSGDDLDRLISSRHDSIQPLATRLTLLSQLARGLGYAHSQGVVHRDIKPSNLRLLEDGVLKIMDFGIAKSNRGDTSLTATGETMGTSTYLSPEQVRGDTKLDAGCDIYAFGAVAFEVLCFRPLYTPSSPQRLIYQIVKEPAPDLGDVAPDLPPRLCAVVRRCLQKERPLRYANCGELLMELNQIDPSQLRTKAPVPERPRRPSETSHETHEIVSKPGDPTHETDEIEPPRALSERRASHSAGSSRSAQPSSSARTGDDSDEFDTADVAPLLSETHGASDLRTDVGPLRSAPQARTGAGAWSQRLVLLIVLSLVGLSVFAVWWRSRSGEPETVTTRADSTVRPRSPAPAQPTGVTTERPPPAPAAQAASLRILPGWDPGIRVSIDGENAEILETELLRQLAPGRHVLEFSVLLDDYQAFENLVIELEPQQRLVIEPPLAEPGRLTFRAPSTSRELFVRLDGSPLGWTPVEARRVEPGTHQLEVAASPQSEERRLTVQIDSAVETTVIAGLDQRVEVVVRQRPLSPSR